MLIAVIAAVIAFRRRQNCSKDLRDNKPRYQLLTIWVLDGICFTCYYRRVDGRRWYQGQLYSVRKNFPNDTEPHPVSREDIERHLAKPGNYAGKGGYLDWRKTDPSLTADSPAEIEILYQRIAEFVRANPPKDSELPALSQQLAEMFQPQAH